MNTQERQIIDSGERDATIGGYVIDRKALKNTIYKLSKIDNFKAASCIARQWFIIAGAVLVPLGTLYGLTGSFNLIQGLSSVTWLEKIIIVFVYITAGIIVATRQHALAVIMHDAAHRRLFTNSNLNDLISDLFCSFPISLSTSLYRYRHLAHHRYINTPQDPDWLDMEADQDWHWPKKRNEAFKVFLGDIFGLNLHKWGRVIAKWSPVPRLFSFGNSDKLLSNQERFLFIGFWIVITILLTLTNSWVHFLLLWVIPQLTFLNLFARIRAISEHLGLPDENELNQSRHIEGTWLERASIAPMYINYHLEHHSFPSIPSYNLPEMRQQLMKQKNYRLNSKFSPNYLSLKNGVLSELII